MYQICEIPNTVQNNSRVNSTKYKIKMNIVISNKKINEKRKV